MGRFSVALVHHPVRHKDGSTITSAVTNTDLHDIARSCTAFGVDRFYIVTPVHAQRELCRRLVHHWTQGAGARKNPDRALAFSCMEVVGSIQEALALESAHAGAPAVAWSTAARAAPGTMSFPEARQRIDELPAVLMLLGTAHGLADDALALCTGRLEPIRGRPRADGTEYNHLSVRAAAAIMLERLRGPR
ncbi:MAG: RNA methyltransferase [Myxococcota bacterium]